MNAFGHYREGDVKLVQVESEKAEEIALDPFYAQFTKPGLGLSYFVHGQLQEAEDVFQSMLDFSEKRGLGNFTALAQVYLSSILIAKGQMRQGFKNFEEAQAFLLKNNLKIYYGLSEFILGVVYTQFITGPSPGFSTLIKNIGSLVKNAPSADRKAEEHYNKAIEILSEIGAKGDIGHAFFGLGRLHKAKKRNEKARECFLEAINLFQECDAHIYLQQARDALASVE